MYYVYRFLDKSKNIIYVGKSKQELEQRFKGHNHLPDECYSSVHKIEFISCSTETDMNIKEIFYINKYNKGNGYFNILDVADLPKSVEFDDKWKMYRGALPSHFSKSINYKKGYSSKKEAKYNMDGTVDKRHSNKIVGESSYVDALSKDEVILIAEYLIERINSAPDQNKRDIWFRNFTMFVISTNLPLKSEDFLNLKYKDIFDKKDKPKAIELRLTRFYKDETINIPLKSVVIKVLSIYRQKFNYNFLNNSEDVLFTSRKGQKITGISWGRILKDAATAVNIKKNINTESIRKTYGLNIYKASKNKLKAILFLGEIWGQTRETKLIKYLNLTEEKIDFDYFLGETFALCDVDLNKIEFLCENPQKKQIVIPQKANIDSSTTKRYSNTLKLEIISKHLKEKISKNELAKQYKITENTISCWINDYLFYGEQLFTDND